MKHLGDITKLNGAEIPVVDCITGGSPCQDLSIAGKRAGLAGERSGLFMEQVRIVKEMREEDKKRGRTGQFIRPRYMVWENVLGAFSSNKGKDFAAVLEETIRVVCPEAPPVPVPEKGWPKSGCLYDGMGRWSAAWRVHDAQFWGVPQRRKRIALVADFGGLSAPEVLFERKGMSWHPDESGETRQGTAAATESSTLGAISFQERGGKPGGGKGILIQEERTGALSTLNNQSVICLQGNMIDRDVKMNGIGVSEEPMYSLNTVDRHGVLCLNDQGGSVMGVSEDVAGSLRAQEHGHQPVVCAGFDHSMGAKAGNIGYEEERAPTLNAQKNMSVYDARGNGDGAVACTITGDHQNRVTDYTSVVVGHAYCLQGNTIDRNAKQNGLGISENVAHTMNAVDRNGVCYCMEHGQSNEEICVDKSPCLNCNHEKPIVFDKEVYNSGINAAGGHYIVDGGPAPTLRTSVPPGVCVRHIVRRLTPTECARLQGFPDTWGHPDLKEEFTDDEYRFWLDVRNTHSAINGKQVKEYTKKQMLTWYNKLHTDSAEYKMWGNGIALPPALYCMQRMVDALSEQLGGSNTWKMI